MKRKYMHLREVLYCFYGSYFSVLPSWILGWTKIAFAFTYPHIYANCNFSPHWRCNVTYKREKTNKQPSSAFCRYFHLPRVTDLLKIKDHTYFLANCQDLEWRNSLSHSLVRYCKYKFWEIVLNSAPYNEWANAFCLSGMVDNTV
jgi:hypothetical protein